MFSPQNKPGVVIDCERMKYPFTGLHQFCKHLGQSLLQTAQQPGQLHFYLPQSLGQPFGPAVNYVHQKAWHRHWLPLPAPIGLWHCTHQTAAYLPANKNIPVLLTIHDLNYLLDEDRPAFKKRRFVHRLQRIIDRSAAVVCISHFTMNEVKQHFRLGQQLQSVIYNGSTIEPLQQLTPPVHIPTTPFLFTIGTIAEKKNFHVLPPLLKTFDGLLIIAGITQDAGYKKRIEAVAEQHGVRSRLVFTGPVTENDKQWYLKNCTAFLFPSLAEGFGLPVVEAAHFGKPIFLANVTSLPEIGGPHAYYFQNFDPQQMQQTLAWGLSEFEGSGRREGLLAHAQKFSFTEAAKQYHQLYQQLLVSKS